MDASAIVDAFSDAVIFLNADGEKGTGYLIDAENGLVLTAGHVVAYNQCDARSKRVKDIGGSLKDGTQVRLTLINSLCSEDKDLALLQLSPKDGMKGVRALNLTLRAPQELAVVTTLGYPQGERTQAVEVGHVERVSPLQIAHASAPGLSGSPAIDGRGYVIGTAVTQVSSASARFVPSSWALPLLQGIAPGPRVMELDRAVRAGTSGGELTLALIPGPRGLSSASLISWAEYIVQGVASYKRSGQYFRCPIVQAYMHRQLDDEVIKFVGLVPLAAEIGRASINIGQRELILGNAREARIHLQKGLENLSSISATYLRANPKSAGIVSCNAGATFSWGPFKASSVADCGERRSQTDSDQYLSGLYRDQALAALKLAEATDSEQRADLLRQTALSSAAVSIWSSGEASQTALSYTYLGDALRGLDRTAEAGPAYATAYGLGLRANWVGTNWSEAVQAATGYPRHPREVGVAPRLNGPTLLDTVPLLAQSLKPIR